MSRLFYHTMQDNVGNLLFGVSGTMRLAGTGTLATIYGDEALTVVLPNPMTNHPSFGSFKCFLGAGDYDFYMAKAGYTFETLTGVQGHGSMAQQDAAAVAITGGSITGVEPFSADGTTFVVDNGNHRVGIKTAGGPGYDLDVEATVNGVRILGPVGIGRIPDPTYALVLAFDTAAKPGGGSWTNSTSSATLKAEIADLTGAVETLRRLRPRTWQWRYPEAHGTLHPAGFVMEEVAEDLPAWVDQGPAGPTGLQERGAIAYLVAAVKELAQQVDVLTARLDAVGG